jgi:hypothetical protein
MNDIDRLQHLLGSAVPPVGPDVQPRDLWPIVAARLAARPKWSWIDLTVAIASVAALLALPRAWLVLVFHL